MTAAVEDPDVAVEMVKSTGIDCGVLVAPVAETVMVVEYVPAASPEMFMVAVNEVGAVPEVEESESHAAVVLALQSNVLVPELEMVTVCGTGLLPPCVAENARPVGLRPIVDVRFGLLSRPYAFPFPGFAMPAPFAESAPSLQPVISGRQRNISPSTIELKRSDSRAVVLIAF